MLLDARFREDALPYAGMRSNLSRLAGDIACTLGDAYLHPLTSCIPNSLKYYAITLTSGFGELPMKPERVACVWDEDKRLGVWVYLL